MVSHQSIPEPLAMGDEDPSRSEISDELDVPTEQPTEADGEHILSLEELSYPTIRFSSGSISPTDGIELTDSHDRAGIQSVLRDLDDALTSHDLCLEGPDIRTIFGLGPGSVSVEFDPDEDHVGTLSITIDLKAKALTYADVETREVGARGGLGFIPKGMLTGEIDPDGARCYNWIEDPVAHLDDEGNDCEESVE